MTSSILALWAIALCAMLTSVLIALFGRREGVTIGQLCFAGSALYRNLPALVTPGAARWVRLSAVFACALALLAVALILLRVWSGSAA